MKIPYVCTLRKTFPRYVAAFFLVLFWPVFAGVAGAEEGRPVILALGDSLTAGFGVPEQESYPSYLQADLKEKGYPHRVVNAGVSGDTTAGGLRRVRWLMQHQPVIVILALGANDGLRGLPLDEMYSNLEQIIRICREHKARVLLAGMKIPPNYGADYATGFEAVYSRLAEENRVKLIPFLLDGVAAKRELTRDDGIHPLGAGYRIVARTVMRNLEPMLVPPSP